VLPKYLTVLGLIFDIAGVATVWFFGWPQPNLEPGVGLGLEDGTPIGPSGETVAELNRKKERRRIRYKRAALCGLLLLLAGFGLQLAAQLI